MSTARHSISLPLINFLSYFIVVCVAKPYQGIIPCFLLGPALQHQLLPFSLCFVRNQKRRKLCTVEYQVNSCNAYMLVVLYSALRYTIAMILILSSPITSLSFKLAVNKEHVPAQYHRHITADLQRRVSFASRHRSRVGRCLNWLFVLLQ